MFEIFNKFWKSISFKYGSTHQKSVKNTHPSVSSSGTYFGKENTKHTVVQVQAINSDLENVHSKFGKYYLPDADVIESECFFRAIGPVIRFGQIFTLMPIVNCLGKDLSKITFKWNSFQTYNSIFGICCSLFEYILFLRVTVKQQINVEIIAANAFFVTNCLGQMLLFEISIKWKTFINQWTEWEQIFLYPPYRMYKVCLNKKVRFATFLILGAACGEHILYVAQAFYTDNAKIKLCGYRQSIFELIYYNVKYHFYVVFKYNEFVLLISEWINLTMAISWTFIDVLIVAISIALTTRFEQINDRVRLQKGLHVSEAFWIDIRSHYNKLVDSVKLVDKYFGSIILLSCSNNMYFICQQLYNSVKKEFNFDINRIYFWITFSFVFLRAMTVLFSAAQIHDVSVRSLGVMRNIPSNSWSVEAARFTEQMIFQCVALSAHNFFSITRRLIFAMAGALITYEIVLLDQLDLESFNEFHLCNNF